MRVLRISHSAVVTAWRERERTLRRRGIDVRLLSARTWNEGGERVTLQPLHGERVAGVRTFGSHPALFVYDPVALWHAFAHPWDIVDIHEEPFALATAEILAIRWLRRRRGSRAPHQPYLVYSAQNIPKRYPWPFGQLERHVLRHAAAVSVCNDEAGHIVRDKGASGLVETIPLGVDTDQFSPGPAVPREHAGSITVGYAGRLATHKGVDTLVDAVAGDTRLRVRIAGAGPQEVELRARAAPLGDRAHFLGSLDQDALVDFYRSLDVLAVPSRTTPGWIEQFGRVAIEAMACGIPVVASDSGALPDVVADAGLLVPPGDITALRSALVRIGTEPGLAPRLRQAGRSRAAHCSWESVARSYQRLYEQVTRPRSTPLPGTARQHAEQPEVIVVAYGSPHLLRDALTPLSGQLPVTVVDNSADPHIRALAATLGARYLDPGRNSGFAAGVNYGLAHRQYPGRDVLLLNPDAVVSAGDVQALQRTLHATGAASVGPAQVDGDGIEAKVIWPYPSPGATWIEAVGLAGLRRTHPRRSFVVGSVLLLSAAALEDVGAFDERFFLYAEETDWAYRAHRKGWRHVLVPGVRALHWGGATSSDPVRRATHFHASQERYLRKHYGSLGWHLARTGALVGAAGRSIMLRGPSRQAARLRVRLYAQGPVAAEELVRTSSAGATDA